MPARKVPLDYDLLHDLYVNQDLTCKQIAVTFDAKHWAVESTLKRLGISKDTSLPDCEVIKNLYFEKGLSMEGVAEELSVPFWRIRRAFKEYGIEADRKKIPRDKDSLYELYVKKGMTAGQIGEVYGINKQTVLNALRDVGIPVRKKGYDPIYKKYCDWSRDDIYQIYLGGLMGDGGVFETGRKKCTVHYREGHSINQRDYVKWKNEFFKFKYFETRRSPSKIVPYEGVSSYICSDSHPFLNDSYKTLYRNGKKNIGAILNDMGDLGLLVWFLDDGTWSNVSITISTESFSKEDHVIMCNWFKERYDVKPTICEVKGGNHWQGKLNFCGDRARKLTGIFRKEFVEHKLPVSMAYKVCHAFKYKGRDIEKDNGKNMMFKPPDRDVIHKNDIEMKEISYIMADEIIKKYHYTRTKPRSYINLGFYIDGWLAGVICYGKSVNPYQFKSISGDMGEGDGFELQRLFTFDWVGKNAESMIISMSIKYIKKKYSHIKCLVSFADPMGGHTGMIYQATNWIYTGITNESNGWVDADGIIHPQRSIRGKKKEVEQKGKEKGWKRIKLMGKHRYVYPLRRHLNLKYQSLNYPK